MEIASFVVGAVGLLGTVVFGIRSRRLAAAFSRYVQLDEEAGRLRRDAADYSRRVEELQAQKSDVYRTAYAPKSKAFVPGDRVKLVEIPTSRGWITEHARIGMTGVVVDYGPGTYEFTVYWSSADYQGKPMDEHGNAWQTFFVSEEQIRRLG